MIIKQTGSDIKKQLNLQIRKEEEKSPDRVELTAKKVVMFNRTSPSKTTIDPGILCGSTGAGYGMFLGGKLSGLETSVHEYGHKAMLESLYENGKGTVQVDGIDNIKNFLKDPSVDNLKKAVTLYDVNQDKKGGVTLLNYGDGPSAAGEILGTDGRRAVIAAAGTTAVEIPALLGFVAGFKMRKNHPFTGYSLMVASGFQHLSNSIYPISAAMSGPKSAGHDWNIFAKATGIPPAVTASIFALTLPAIAGGLYLMEQHCEEKAHSHLALASLIAKGKIPESELTDIFENYDKKNEILSIEDRLSSLLNRKDGDKDENFKKDFKKITGELARKYYGFGEYLITKYEDKVQEEKKNIPRSSGIKSIIEDVKTSYKNDKVGTIFAGSAITGSIAISLKSSFDTLNAIAPGAIAAAAGVAGNALSPVIPAVGVISTAGAIYNASKVIRNPESSKMDKFTAAGIAAFTGITAAGSLVPSLQVPLTITGIAGLGGTFAAKWLASKMETHDFFPRR